MAEFTSTVELKANTGKLERSMANARKSVDKLNKSTRDVNGKFATLGRKGSQSLNKLNKSAITTNASMSRLQATLISIASGAAAIAVGRGIARSASKFEILRAQLKTMTGDSKKAEIAFNRLKKFSDVTPFNFDQSVKGFVKLKALGLVSTIEEGEKALKSYGNTAAAMGKTLEQMVEAVADAATGENERLKEFGIKAKKQGEETAYTFQGVTTVVKNSARDIQKYLLGIGNVQFAGAMTEQAKGITAAMSNITTNFELFLDAIGNGMGLVNAMTDTFNGLSNVLTPMSKAMNENTESFQKFKKVMVGIVATGTAFLTVFAASKLKAIAFGMLSITKAAMLNPIFVVGGIAGFAVVKLFEKFGGFADGISVAMDRISFVWNMTIASLINRGVFGELVDATIKKAKDLATTGVAHIQSMATSLTSSFKSITNSETWGSILVGYEDAKTALKGAYNFIAMPVADVYASIKNINWSSVWTTLETSLTTVKGWFTTADLWGTFLSGYESVKTTMKGVYNAMAMPIASAFMSIKSMSWSTMWGTLETSLADAKSWFSEADLWETFLSSYESVKTSMKGAYNSIAMPIANMFMSIKTISWSTMWGTLETSLTTVKGWFSESDLWGTFLSGYESVKNSMKGAYNAIAMPIASVFMSIKTINWESMWTSLKAGITGVNLWITDADIWGTFLVGYDKAKTAMKEAYNKLAMPIASVHMYIKTLDWESMWAGLKSGIESVKKWFWDLYIYLVGNSVVPEMVTEILSWFDWLVTWAVSAAHDVYLGVTKWFSDLWKNLSKDTKDGVSSVKDSMDSLYNPRPETQEFSYQLQTIIDKLKSMSTVALAVGAVVGTVFAVGIVTRFKNSISRVFDTFRSADSTLSGKQGLMNRIMFGTTDGARQAATAVRHARERLTILEKAEKLKAERLKTGNSQLKRTGGGVLQQVENMRVNTAASADSIVLRGRKNDETHKIDNLRKFVKDSGPVQRFFTGQDGKTGVVNRLKGFSSQVLAFVKSFRSITLIASGVITVLGKIALPLTAILAVYDAWTGWSDAIDKDKDGVVSTFEKMQGATGKVVDGLTLGLISAEETSDWMDRMFSGKIDETLTAMFQVSPFGLVDSFLTKVSIWIGDWLGFDTTSLTKYQEEGGLSGIAARFVEGMWTSTTATINGWFEDLSTTDQGRQDVLTPFGKTAKGIADMSRKAYDAVTGLFKGEIKPDDERSIVSQVSAGISNAWENATAAVSQWFQVQEGLATFDRSAFGNIAVQISLLWDIAFGGIKSWFEGDAVAYDGKTDTLGEEIGTGLTNLWKNIKTLALSWFSFELPSFGSLKDSITDAIKGVFEKIKDAILGFGSRNFTEAKDGENKAAYTGLYPPMGDSGATRTTSGNPGFGGMATGGSVRGAGTGTSDSIPKMLSNGEFVVNAKDSSQNRGLLNAINGGQSIPNTPGPINANRLLKQMHSDEGSRLDAYLDTEKKLTVGFGHKVLPEDNIEFGQVISQYRANKLFAKDLPTARDGASRALSSFERAPSELKEVLTNMVYQMGTTGVKKFKNMRTALDDYDYGKGAEEMLDSTWAKQTPNRANRLAGTVARIQNTQGYATGGAVKGAGTGTSDSIPAMLSNGEFVVNAAAVRGNMPLLDALNSGKGISEFSTGGPAGGAGIRLRESKKIPAGIQFGKDGLPLYSKTMELYLKSAEKGSEAAKVFSESLRILVDATNVNNLESLKSQDLYINLNKNMKDEIVQAEARRKSEEDAVESVEELSKATKDAAEVIKDTWGGFGQTLTGDLKDALSRADFSSVGDAIGSGIRKMAQRVSSKILDRAFAPLEAGLDNWLMSMDTMEVKGEGMFERLGNVGVQAFGGLFSSIGRGLDSFFGSQGTRGGSGGGSGGFFSGGSFFDNIGSMLGFATGGHVSGPGSGTSDSIMARLSNGEFVVNAAAARGNRPLLDSLNSGNGIPGFAKGTPADKDSKGGFKSGLAGLLKFLIPGSGIMEFLSKMQTGGPNGMFPDSKLGGLMPDLPTRAVMERGRGFNTLNNGGTGGFNPNEADVKRAEERRTGLVDRMLTTKARKDELQQLTTKQRAAYEAGVRQKDDRGLFNNANDVLSRVSGGKLGKSNAERQTDALTSILEGRTSNFTDKDGNAIRGAANSFSKDDPRLMRLKAAQELARGQTASRYDYKQGGFSSLISGIGNNVTGSYKQATSQNLGARFNYASPNEQKVVKTRDHSFGGTGGSARSTFSGSNQAANRANRAINKTSSYASKAAGVQQTFRQTSDGSFAGGFAAGGRVNGPGSGTSDSIMAKLSNGEFVVNARASQANLGLLTQINGGSGKRNPNAKVPKFATGGQAMSGGSGGDAPIYLTLNNNYDVQSAMNPQEFQAMLVNNSELSFLSVEKKLRETGRSLYK